MAETPQPMHLTLLEYEQQELDPQQLCQMAGINLPTLADVIKPLVQLSLSLSGTVTAKADRVVGTIQVGQLRIDVRPRMAADELVTMVRYALGGQPRSHRHSTIGLSRTGLDELICTVFTDELASIRQSGLSRQYVSRLERLEVLRGRPDFLGSFPWNDDGMAGLSCRFHELTCDNLDNQLIRSALERATLFELRLDTRRKILDHRHIWTAIASPRQAALDDFRQARSRYTRLTSHYRLAHNLAEVILRNGRPALLFAEGPVVTAGLSLDMAEIFELFVTRLLSEQLHPLGMKIGAQERDSGAFTDGAGRYYGGVRPDIIVYRRVTPVAVIDAKYKDYWMADVRSGSPVRRISNEDLYQLFFYIHRIQVRHGLSTPPPAFVISPLPAEDERRDTAEIAKEFRDLTYRAGSASSGRLQLILLPLTQIVRTLARAGAADRPLAVPELRSLAFEDTTAGTTAEQQ